MLQPLSARRRQKLPALSWAPRGSLLQGDRSGNWARWTLSLSHYRQTGASNQDLPFKRSHQFTHSKTTSEVPWHYSHQVHYFLIFEETYLISDSAFQCFQADNLGTAMLLSGGEMSNLQAGIPHKTPSKNAAQIKLLVKAVPHEVLSISPKLLKPTADILI